MSATTDILIKNLAKSIVENQNKNPSAYDTSAEVRRIEGNTAWVHIPGGVDETPVQLTTNAKKGDIVQVRVSGGRAWLYGNVTAPPTDDTTANKAQKTAAVADEHATNAVTSAMLAQQFADAAKDAADSAQADATIAKQVTDEITEYAETAEKSVTEILEDAEEARVSATNASEYAARALGNLSTVQNVTETLNWITSHGTMTLTTDTELDPTHVYFVRDNDGDYHIGSYYYSIVTFPNIDDISTYYELSIDESLNNYVATHLALTNYGLDLWSDGSNSYRLHQGTIDGSGTYPFGVYILTLDGRPIAQFTGNKMQLGLDTTGHITITTDAETGGNIIEFWENESSRVAYITNSEMSIGRTIVLQSMKIGNWQWTYMNSGNMRLQWTGG